MKLWKISLISFGAIIFMGAQPELTLKQLTIKLEQNFEQTKTYQAKFEQEVRSQQFGRSISKGKGELYYSKPGKIYWHYTEPEEHFYITDGKILWDYLPETKQVLKVPIEEAFSSNLPRSFLFGMTKISEQFEVNFSSEKGGKDSYSLNLVPRKDEDKLIFGSLELLVDAKTFLVKEARLKDMLGNENILWFSEIKINPKLNEKMFNFKPPAGVNVIKPPVQDNPSVENQKP